MNTNRLLTVEDVATLLAVSPSSVWRWTRAGRLVPPLRLCGTATRWSEADLNAWLAEQREASQPKIYEVTTP